MSDKARAASAFGRVVDAVRDHETHPMPSLDDLTRRNDARRLRRRRSVALVSGVMVAAAACAGALALWLTDREDAISINAPDTPTSPSLQTPSLTIATTLPSPSSIATTSPSVVAPTHQSIASSRPPVATQAIPSTVIEIPNNETLITGPPSDQSPEGIVGGLLLLRNGCFYIDDTDAGLGVAVFVSGTTWDATTGTVVGPDGTEATVGQQAYAVGGTNVVEALNDAPDSLGAAVRHCAEMAETSLFFGVYLVASPL